MRRLNFILLSGLLFVCPSHASLATLWDCFNEHCETQNEINSALLNIVKTQMGTQLMLGVVQLVSTVVLSAKIVYLQQRIDATQEELRLYRAVIAEGALPNIDCPMMHSPDQVALSQRE